MRASEIVSAVVGRVDVLREKAKLRRRSRTVLEAVDNVYARVVAPRFRGPARHVLVVGRYRDNSSVSAPSAISLYSSRHSVDVRLTAVGEPSLQFGRLTVADHVGMAKFAAANAALADYATPDWLLILEESVELPRGFLDSMVEVCDRYDFALAQPALTRSSHANWGITRRRSLTVARETAFVAIGPVTLIRADALQALRPFPDGLRYGWALEFQWSYIMQHADLRMGVVDLLAVRRNRPDLGADYSWDDAQDESHRYLAGVARAPGVVATQEFRRYRIPRPGRRP